MGGCRESNVTLKGTESIASTRTRRHERFQSGRDSFPLMPFDNSPTPHVVERTCTIEIMASNARAAAPSSAGHGTGAGWWPHRSTAKKMSGGTVFGSTSQMQPPVSQLFGGPIGSNAVGAGGNHAQPACTFQGASMTEQTLSGRGAERDVASTRAKADRSTATKS